MRLNTISASTVKKIIKVDKKCTSPYTPKEKYLVDENFSAMNMGTYNYYGPTQMQKHNKIDVAPWEKWENTPKGWIWSDWID